MVTGCFIRSRLAGAGLRQSTLTCISTHEEMVMLRHVSNQAGTSYYLPDDVIHRVTRSEDQACTLVLTHPPSREAYIYDLVEEHADAAASQATVHRANESMQDDELVAQLFALLDRLRPQKSRAQ